MKITAWIGIVFCFGVIDSAGLLYRTNELIQNDTIYVSIDIDNYSLQNSKTGKKVLIPEFGRLSAQGEPWLPSRIYSIALPPYTEFKKLRFTTSEGITLPGSHYVSPVYPPHVMPSDPTAKQNTKTDDFSQTYASIYGMSTFYPVNIVKYIGTSGFREYNMVDVKVTPFQYRPKTGELRYFSKIFLYIEYSNPQDHKLKSSQIHSHNKTKNDRFARKIIKNYEQARSWYAAGGSRSSNNYDFVLITTDSLAASVDPLVEWERSKGRSVKVVTTSWIESNFPGFDIAAKIRNFLREKYSDQQWGIQDVLIVGHRDDVPMRRTFPGGTGNPPETDYYYAELSRPDSESWDSDGDFQYGEDSDQIDYYGEVNVGRIPWSDPAIVQSICIKSAAYEQNTDPAFKNNILLLAAFVDENTDGAEFMEYTVDTDIHPWMAQWKKTRMYEPRSEYAMDNSLNQNNVVSVWSSGKFSVVSWHAHGSPTGSYVNGGPFISVSDCVRLNDAYPAIISAASCSNADTDFLNIGQAMLRQGAVGFLGANKSAYYAGGWKNPADGSDQSFKYFFLSCVTSGDYTQGQALQYAIREMYTRGLWIELRRETFLHSSLFGNPDLGIFSPFISNPPDIPLYAGGISQGRSGTDYTFHAKASDIDLDQVYLCWSWGDGKIDWLGPYTSGEVAAAQHSWSMPGNYIVKVKAKDEFGVESGWSESFHVAIDMEKRVNRPRRYDPKIKDISASKKKAGK